MYTFKNENRIAFYLALIMAIFLTSAFVYAIAYGQAYNLNEMASAISGSSAEKPEVKVEYEVMLEHTDGSKLPLRLVSFIKGKCRVIPNIGNVCYGGFTDKTSNDTRKVDQEKPVDTSEVINLEYKKGNVINMQDFVHESNHAVMYHFMSRVKCETNWRYTECLEPMAYDQQYLYEQLIELSKAGKIKLKF